MRAVSAAVLFLATLPVFAATDADVPLGIEAVAGYRSAYLLRGMKLAGDTMDFQLESEIALSNDWLLSIGGWYATGTGDDDFSETSAFAELRYEQHAWTASLNLTGRSYNHAPTDSGVEIGPSFTWHADEDFDLTTGVLYDDAAEGGYGFVEGHWSKPVGDNAFVTLLGGASVVANYYDRSGGNDVYGRVSYTYNFNKTVSVTPFAGFSAPFDANPEPTRGYAGMWFEVNF